MYFACKLTVFRNTFAAFLPTVGALATASPLVVPRNEEQSSIWCGQDLTGQNVKTVEASWTIPNVSYPADANVHQQYYSSQWIGIAGMVAAKVYFKLVPASV